MLPTWSNQENQVKSSVNWRTRSILQTVLVGARFWLVWLSWGFWPSN